MSEIGGDEVRADLITADVYVDVNGFEVQLCTRVRKRGRPAAHVAWDAHIPGALATGTEELRLGDACMIADATVRLLERI
jgi:hypothetical protein